MLNKRNSLPSNDRRKSSVAVNLDKDRSTIKINETKSGTLNKPDTREYTNTSRKSIVSTSINAHRKSDADKSFLPDIPEKGNHTYFCSCEKVFFEISFV